MKKRSPFLPAFLAIFSIASIGIIYGNSAKSIDSKESAKQSTPVSAQLKDVSGKELLTWMTDNNIQFLTEHPEKVSSTSTKYSVYFDHASPQDIVGAISVVLGTEWHQEGEIFVLTPREELREEENSSEYRPKRVPFPIKGIQEDISGAAKTFGGKLVATMTKSQLRDQLVHGLISTDSLSEEQKQLIQSEIRSNQVNIIIATQGRVVYLKGEI